MKATGTKTAASTRVIVTIGVAISAMAARVAARGLKPRSRYFSTFSTTMMASSTTRPMASTRPIRVSVLIEKPKAAMRPKVPTSETGMAISGIRVARKPCKEDEHDDEHEDEGLDQGVLDLGDVFLDVVGRVEGDAVLEVGGKVGGQPIHLLADLLDDRQRVGVAELVDGDRGGGLAAQVAGLVVGFGAELDAGDILDLNDGSIGPGANDDLFELLGGFEPALGGDRVFEGLTLGDRRRADLAGGGLAVLGLDGVDHLLGADLLIGHAVGVEPDRAWRTCARRR